MATNEEIFLREFTQMMNGLKANTGFMDINEVPLPPEAKDKFFVEHCEILAIGGIEDEYYSRLNNSESLLWNRGQLSRHKADYKGEYMKDKQGNYIYEPVTLPNECVAVISDINIGVPRKHKPTEKFEYVDMIQRTLENGEKQIKYVYIVPRKYCYKINQTALIITLRRKNSAYYDGVALSLRNGYKLFVYIIPYKPTVKPLNYRVLMSKTDIDYTEELNMLRDYWLKINYIFDPNKCQMLEAPKGIENVAVQVQDGIYEEYVRFDTSKTLDKNNDGFSEDIDIEEFV